MRTKEYAAEDAARVKVEILEQAENTLLIRWVEPGRRCHSGEQRRDPDSVGLTPVPRSLARATRARWTRPRPAQPHT